MSDVLVVQPDAAQAETLRDICHRIGAGLVVVHSTGEALDAIALRIPDLILFSTLLSPRDEDVLMAHLRSLEGASHLQTLNIPQFRSATEKAPARKSGFSFRKKQKAQISVGCDPAVFAEEVVANLRRAADIRSRPVALRPAAAVIASPPEPVVAVMEEPHPVASAPAEPEPFVPEPAVFEPVVFEPVAPEPLVVEPFARVQAEEPVNVHPVSTPVSTDDDEVDRIARELGLDAKLKLLEIEDASGPSVPGTEPEEAFDFGAALDRARGEAEERRTADLARVQADTEAIREAAMAEARAIAEREAREALAVDLARIQAEAEAMREAAMAEAEALREAAIAEARATAEREARDALAADLARVQAEAEAMREATIAEAEVMREAAIVEARAAAEREARETLDAELARVRSETEVTVADALNKVKLEAEEAERGRVEAERLRVEAQQAFAAELARVRADVERSLAAQLDAARADAERMRAVEANAARDRAAVETQLKSEIDRLRFVAAQTRKADESETRKAAEQIKQLEGELAGVRAKAEERQIAQLEELRVQMAEMREAAADHARAAAAEAVASEVARATAQQQEGTPRKLNVIRMQPRPTHSEPTQIQAAEASAAAPVAEAEEGTSPQQKGDYYSLWQETPSVTEPPDETDEIEEPRINFRRHAKWALLPIAACLLLVTRTGTAIDSVARFVTPAERPALTVEPVEVAPFIEVVEKRVGRLQVESTPAGAEAIVDGRSYGQTPVTIPDLEVGGHTLVLKSSEGTITRRVTVRANETAAVSEAIFSGWLAIFSPIPVTVVIDGQPVSLSDDGRAMATPGKHVVELISERFNFRVTETLVVKPGETTAYTASIPMGSVRVIAPEGVEIRVDGQPAVGVPGEGLSVAVGSHEITATHPELGERRVAVDVLHGTQAEVALQFEQ